MNYLIGLFGLVVGLFLWSNILGSLFGTLPVEKMLKQSGKINNVSYLRIILPIIFSGAILLVSALFWKYFFYGSIVGGVLMLFNLGKLRGEALENATREHKIDINKN